MQSCIYMYRERERDYSIYTTYILIEHIHKTQRVGDVGTRRARRHAAGAYAHAAGAYTCA